MIKTFLNSTIYLAGGATLSSLALAPAAQANDINSQVYSVQQSLRATNARVDRLEKEVGQLHSGSGSKQHQVSYPGNKKQERPSPPTQGGTIHHVASGDTLSSISRRYGIGLDRLVASNPGLDPHRIRIGQQIVVPRSGAGAPAKQPVAAAVGAYKVQAGDTLSSIARNHNTSATQLLSLNQLANPNSLSIGQTLTVPSGSSKAPSGNRYGSQPKNRPAPAPVAAPAPEPEPEPTEPDDLLTAPEGYGYYEVISRDTLYSIALSFGTTSRELRRLNELEGDDELSVGQYLLVPVADDSLYES